VRASSFLAIVIASTTIVAAPSVCTAEDLNPCGSARFSERLVTISFVSLALNLLNGNEDPKLRRLLEWKLGEAAEDAKVQLDRGATAEGEGLPMPNLSRDFRVARTYASSHHLSGTVIANLTALEAWVSKQPWGPSLSPR
jgi:hypothetical protein